MASIEGEDDLDSTLGALRDLVQSAGWAAFWDYVKKEYGPEGYGRLMQAAVAGVPNGPDRPYELARIAEQVDATAKAVNTVMAWPGQEIARRSHRPPRRAFEKLRRGTG